MLNKERTLKEIIYWISHLSTSASLGGKIHFFDLNIVAEDFYADLLSIIYSLHLKNLNKMSLNAVAVDLGDFKNRVCIQVTSNRTLRKVQDTINKFEKNHLSQHFDHLKIVIIGEKTGKYPTLTLPSSISFDRTKDIIGNSDIIKSISSLSEHEISEILTIMKRDIVPRKDIESSVTHTDHDVLNEYRDYFDRSALKDRWDSENNYSAFKDALTDLLAIMHTGILNGICITKSRFKIDDDYTRQELASIAEQLRCLREFFNCHVRNGNIDLELNRVNFSTPEINSSFDSQRKSIIEQLNILFIKSSIPIIKY